MENMFKELLSSVYTSVLKPQGWKKDKSNFRFFCDDGLCKIINFQKSRWNTKQECQFFINMGLYIEKTNDIENQKFHEYECQLRKRTSSNSGIYKLDCGVDLSTAKEQVSNIINEEVLSFFEKFESKEQFVNMLLSGEAQNYTGIPVMHYFTCKLLSDMGYKKEILLIIKDKKGEPFEGLVKEIQRELCG